MKIEYATISKQGRRSNNEDAFRVLDQQAEAWWMGVVCDGMGGHAMGEVASEAVVKSICSYWETHTCRKDSEAKVQSAVLQANDAIRKKSEQFRCQMGTTMVMASIVDDMITIVHIGDSRCYLLRKNHFDYEDINNTAKDHVVYQTIDHVDNSYGGERVARCFFTDHPEVAVPEVAQFELQPDDRILICSDGVYKSIYPHILKDRMLDDKSAAEIVDVVDSLCEKNGDDNYTAIVAKVIQC